MKKVPLYLLLAIYCFAQLRPLAVVVQDVVAHTFFAAQHMATIHYENGRYHLHKELKAVSQEPQDATSQKSSSSQKLLEDSSPQNISDSQFSFYVSKSVLTFYSQAYPGLQAGFITPAFHPPLAA